MADTKDWSVRRFPRNTLDCAASFSVICAGESQGPVQQGIIRNISPGGLFLDVPDIQQDLVASLIKKQCGLRLEFVLPDQEEPVSATTDLVWLKELHGADPYRYGLALSFRTLDSGSRGTISRFVRKRDAALREAAAQETKAG